MFPIIAGAVVAAAFLLGCSKKEKDPVPLKRIDTGRILELDPNKIKFNKDIPLRVDLFSQNKATGFRPMPTDPEAHLRIFSLDQEKIKVLLIVPYDDNRHSSDGRIYRRNVFMLDPTSNPLEWSLRDFYEVWKYNSKGQPAHKWKKRLESKEANKIMLNELDLEQQTELQKSLRLLWQDKIKPNLENPPKNE